MRKNKILFWLATGFIFLFEGVMPALTSNTQLAIDGIRHLGYPNYFRVMLTIFKILGVLALVLPQVPGRVKEWAYAGFAFNFIAASVSLWVVDGFNGQTIFPLVALAILVVSYTQRYKLELNQTNYTARLA